MLWPRKSSSSDEANARPWGMAKNAQSTSAPASAINVVRRCAKVRVKSIDVVLRPQFDGPADDIDRTERVERRSSRVSNSSRAGRGLVWFVLAQNVSPTWGRGAPGFRAARSGLAARRHAAR